MYAISIFAAILTKKTKSWSVSFCHKTKISNFQNEQTPVMRLFSLRFLMCVCNKCVIIISFSFSFSFFSLHKKCVCLHNAHTFARCIFCWFVPLIWTLQSERLNERDNYCVKRNCGYTEILFTQCTSIGVFCFVLDFVWFTFAARFPLTCSNFRFYFETHFVITPFHCYSFFLPFSFVSLSLFSLLHELYLNGLVRARSRASTTTSSSS